MHGETPHRRARLLSGLAERGLDGLLVTRPANVRYLTGFTGTSGWLLLTADSAMLVTDGRYETQARREAREVDVVVSADGLVAGAARVAGDCGAAEVGFESRHLTVFDHQELCRRGSVDWLPTDRLIEALRARKSTAEVEAVRRALALTEAALAEVAAQLRPGMAERQVAAELEHACRRRGAEGMAFETIVASGPRTSLPHGIASDRVIAAGEVVMIDMGCRLDGYCSDITRMVWTTPDPGDEGRRLHELVARAQAAAIAAVRPGVAARDVDGAARAVIEAAGRGAGFRHGTGHGVGLEVHEAPVVSPRSSDTLEEGMVLTIEPAVYEAERRGVRIEDMVCVSDVGCVRLTGLGPDPILAGTPSA